MSRALSIMVMSLSLMIAQPVWSDEATAPTWSELDGKQQKLLKRYRGKWDEMPLERRAQMVRGAERWQQMTPEQQGKAKQRLKRWKQLPPERKKRFVSGLSASANYHPKSANSCVRVIGNSSRCPRHVNSA